MGKIVTKCCDECPGDDTCEHAQVCMCGDDVNHHSIASGHYPVSMHDYHSLDKDEEPSLNERQLTALRIGEQAIEDLPTRDRDDLIVRGLAVRAWPRVTGVDWKTWLTPEGAALRLKLFDPYGGEI